MFVQRDMILNASLIITHGLCLDAAQASAIVQEMADRFRLLSFLRRQESISPAKHRIRACAGMTGRGSFLSKDLFQLILTQSSLLSPETRPHHHKTRLPHPHSGRSFCLSRENAFCDTAS